MRVAFVGKEHGLTDTEHSLLWALGSALATARRDLVTTPAGDAAASVTEGFRAIAGRDPETSKNPLKTADHVLFYDDQDILRRLFDKEPSPIDDRWTVLSNVRQLQRFISIIT